ncbi:hypothetical protein ACHAXR_010775 [Thalassiosira sp. AJA248-18]
MNNDAFRALVNTQRQEKSTKEIAREAVEDEFQKKRSRGGGGGGRRGRRGFDDGYGSDSGGSSDEDAGGRRERDAKAKQQQQQEDDNEPEWKRRRKEKKLQDAASEYRDRAKERREGNNLDYASLEGLAQQSGEDDRRRRAELSKYLGGDEEHTHLVKGLDKALAEKVRREEMFDGSKESGDLDQLLEDAYVHKQNQSNKPKGAQDWQTTKPKTELGKSVLSYLLQKKKSDTKPTIQTATSQVRSNPTIQKSIQSSILTFSLESDVRQRKNAWEVPRISVTHGSNKGAATGSRKMTPLNHHMIATISKKLVGGAGGRGGKEKSKYNAQHSKGGREDKTNGTSPSEEGGVKDIDRNVSKTKSNTDVSASAGTNGNSTKEDDSDDDIFENIETAPTAPTPKHVHKQQPQQPQQNRQQRRQQKHDKQSSSQNKNVIDRDIFGGQKESDTSNPYHKRRGPQVAAMEGVSMASYQGGYGEEMDVDFGGDDDNRRNKRKYDDKEKDGSEDVAGEQDDGGDDEED